jgi:MFS family permease
MNLYLTFFYTKNELAMHVCFLFVSAAIAGALGGLLAFGISHMDGMHAMFGWRVSFINCYIMSGVNRLISKQ